MNEWGGGGEKPKTNVNECKLAGGGRAALNLFSTLSPPPRITSSLPLCAGLGSLRYDTPTAQPPHRSLCSPDLWLELATGDWFQSLKDQTQVGHFQAGAECYMLLATETQLAPSAWD